MNDAPQVQTLAEEAWPDLAAGFLDYSYRQCRSYAHAAARRVGARSQPVAVVAAGQVLGIADVRTRRLPVLPGGIAYLNGAPLTRRGAGDDLDRLGLCLGALRRHFVDRAGLVLRIVGPIGPVSWIEAARARFVAAGFAATSAVPCYRTLVVDLRRPLQEIRARLNQKWRNGLNQAERNGLTVLRGADAGMFTRFRDLFDGFLAAKGFHVELDAEFYGRVQESLGDRERLELSLVEIGGQAVAGMLCSVVGDTCVYLLGASNDEAHRAKASYLLQWKAIESAHAKGVAAYDLGGIDPDGNPGVFHFKSGLGGVDLSAPGPYQAVPRGLNGHLVLTAERAFRLFRSSRLVRRT